MPISESKKSVQAYVQESTKNKIIKLAKEQDRSESYVAGKLLDKALSDPPMTLSNLFAKMHEK